MKSRDELLDEVAKNATESRPKEGSEPKPPAQTRRRQETTTVRCMTYYMKPGDRQLIHGRVAGATCLGEDGDGDFVWAVLVEEKSSGA